MMDPNFDAKIFTPIAEMLREEFEGIYVTGEYVPAPPRFPAVSIEQADDYTSENRQTSSYEETYHMVMFEVNVYSNLKTGRKLQARQILSKIDELFYMMNFTRLSTTPVHNLADETIYRLVARYRAETDGSILYRR